MTSSPFFFLLLVVLPSFVFFRHHTSSLHFAREVARRSTSPTTKHNSFFFVALPHNTNNIMASVLSMSASLAGKSNVSSKVFSSSSKKMSSRKVSITTRATGSMVDDKTGIKKMRDGIKEAADENLLTPRFYTTGTSCAFCRHRF